MLRVGFLGCGEIAHKRAYSMRALNERGEAIFDVVAACDLSPVKSEMFAARFGGEAFSSVARMIGNGGLDALWICTPPSARGAGENAALAAGIALWIEPPIASNIRTANALALAIKKSGVPVSVCAPHRYSPELERLRRILNSKDAARIELWNGTVGANLLRTAWRGDAKNGSVWLDAAWMMLDLLRFLNLEPQKLSTRSNRSIGVASLELRSDALATLGVSRFSKARELLSGRSEDFQIRVTDWSSTPRVELGSARETSIWNGEDALVQQLEAFARLLRTGRRTENRSTFADALLTLRFGLELK